MNICFLSLDYPSTSGGGGVGNQVRTLGQALVRAGHRVTVVALAEEGQPCPREGQGQHEFSEDGGIRVHRVPGGNVHWYAFRVPGVGPVLTLALRELEYGWALYRRVRALHRREPFDVIEGTETGALLVALGLKEVPLVIRLHGEHYTFHKYTPDLALTPGIRLSRVLQRSAMRRARLLISPSRAHASEIAGELGGRCPKIEVIPNCIDLDRVPQSTGMARDAATVLFVGRLERCKGVPLLLEAARRVLNEHPSARFVLAGGAHPTLPRSEIDSLIRRYSLDGHVDLLGHLTREQLVNWYRKATVCVLPSYYESFGLVALEAMAFGVPVVASGVGGLPELVEDGVTGTLVQPGDARALAGALLRLLSDATLRARQMRVGRDRVSQIFSQRPALERTLSAYVRLVLAGDGPESTARKALPRRPMHGV